MTGEVFDGELERLQGLVDDLLLLAHGDEQALARNPFSIADTVRDVGARTRRVPVDVSVGADVDPLVGDAGAVGRALDHLVRQRRSPRQHRGCASPWLAMPRSSASDVDDDGPGIPRAAGRRRQALRAPRRGPRSRRRRRRPRPRRHVRRRRRPRRAPRHRRGAHRRRPPDPGAAAAASSRLTGVDVYDHLAGLEGGGSLQVIRRGVAVAALAGAAAVLVPTPSRPRRHLRRGRSTSPTGRRTWSDRSTPARSPSAHRSPSVPGRSR